ncbi:hypothetical protein B4O97_15915 [Marispirochaeta aestuarii]|uniref:Methyltransferase type 11 domain-containing protein n=1 Tax=Marispirochaeta aestuarii TaxID=1963862 RepID=A0A1Y1RUE1_9SPIO|nr:class I SAM-dependent methyltransferase [Marispirochaeta aestuarii]ORC32644.1 hypothetical protein B4O97_15915 [Marispirochaeta aestuarii]
MKNKLKILVAIANYGSKNDHYVKLLIESYRRMRHDVEIVIMSNIAKNYAPDIRVCIGLPSKNPWSLPFRHKEIFFRQQDEYDLFIYSEDDTLIEERHVDSFMIWNEYLPDAYIPGFLRYEESSDKKKYISSVHSHFYWDIDSVLQVGPYSFAYFSNLHSASFMLTRKQLKSAIRSKGFMVPPHAGKYDLLCSAATDPYTQCGFNKMICISEIDDCLLHHLPDIYIGKLGIPFDEFSAQLDLLRSNKVKLKSFFNPGALKETWYFDKLIYEKLQELPEKNIDVPGKRVLSVGCGSGEFEAQLIKKGKTVTAIPVDDLIGISSRMKGIEVLSADMNKAETVLKNRKFDIILVRYVLEYIENPTGLLYGLKKFLDKDGQLFIISLNRKNLKYRKILKKLGTEAKKINSAFRLTDYGKVKKWLVQSDYHITRRKYLMKGRAHAFSKISLHIFDVLLGSSILLVARKSEKGVIFD